MRLRGWVSLFEAGTDPAIKATNILHVDNVRVKIFLVK